MPKPFTNEQCTVEVKTIQQTLLEEQAIGDVMQFMTLVPDLLKSRHIGILINNRLVEVWEIIRSFNSNKSVSVWSFSDYQKGLLRSSDYDFQSPMGSVCQYFTDIRKFASTAYFKLIQLVEELSLKYQAASPKNSLTELIGGSWRGGGRTDRIKQKSIDINDFAKLMLKTNGVRFVSLQYGESQSVIEYWRSQGIDIYHDNDVNPLKNMDRWNAQVAACDAVVSVILRSMEQVV